MACLMIYPILTRPSLQSWTYPSCQPSENGNVDSELAANPGYVEPAQDVPPDNASNNLHSLEAMTPDSASG